MTSKVRDERLQIMLSPQELEAVDDFRFQHRMPSRAAAVRELLQLGMAAAGVKDGDGRKSSEFGVFRRGPTGHTQDGRDRLAVTVGSSARAAQVDKKRSA